MTGNALLAVDINRSGSKQLIFSIDSATRLVTELTFKNKQVTLLNSGNLLLRDVRDYNLYTVLNKITGARKNYRIHPYNTSIVDPITETMQISDKMKEKKSIMRFIDLKTGALQKLSCKIKKGSGLRFFSANSIGEKSVILVGDETRGHLSSGLVSEVPVGNGAHGCTVRSGHLRKL